jgi:hypothetical protein
LTEEPSLSAIIRPSRQVNTYLAKEGVDGSMLFSPRYNKKTGLGTSIMEEAIILQTLQMGKLGSNSHTPIGPGERLFAEPSEEINT